jgi:hypothetical protein
MMNLSQYPTELGDSWIHACFVNSEFIKISIGLYKNTTYPTGTIIFSQFTPNQYPDMYTIQAPDQRGSYTELNKTVESNRMYTNPIYRRRGYWKFLASVLRSVFYNNAGGILLEGTRNRSPITNRLYGTLTKLMNHNNPNSPILGGRISMPEQEPPRDPASPVIWFGQRIGGFNG